MRNIVLTENDKRYWMGLDKSASDRFLITGVESKETSEYHVTDLHGVTGSILWFSHLITSHLVKK